LARGYLESFAGITIDPGGLIGRFAPDYALDVVVMGKVRNKTEADSKSAYHTAEAVAGVFSGRLPRVVAYEGASVGFSRYGKGRIAQMRFFEDVLIFRLDNKPIWHLNIQSFRPIPFNWHIPDF
jgi:hypothetical protein